MNATFNLLGVLVTFTRAPLRPERNLTVVVPHRQSANGARFGYARTITEKTLRLPVRMTTTQKDALVAFFTTTTNGMAKPFFYTDTNGTTQMMMFNTPSLGQITEYAYNSWETTLELRYLST